MQVQVYNFNTRFNFGKHEGKSLMEVLQEGQSRYIGWCIFYPVLYFILDPKTIEILNKEQFFDDLDCSFPVDGGSLPISGLRSGNTVYNKEWIMKELASRYEEFNKNPDSYAREAENNLKKYNLTRFW